MGGRSGGGSRGSRSRAGGTQDVGGNTVSTSGGTIEINGRSADYSMLSASDVESTTREIFQTTVFSALQNNSGRTPLREAARQADRRADNAEQTLGNIRGGGLPSAANQTRARAQTVINNNRALSDALNNVADIMPKKNRPGS